MNESRLEEKANPVSNHFSSFVVLCCHCSRSLQKADDRNVARIMLKGKRKNLLGDEICFVRRNQCVPLCSRLQLMRSSTLGLKL